MELQNKVALITGGGKGIGRAVALRFGRAGADLVLTARTREPMEEVAAELAELGRTVLVVPGDAADEACAIEAVGAALARFGRLDILVNNVGIAGATAPVTEISREDWDRALAVNLTSAFLFCKHALPPMIERRSGCVVMISSLSGTRGQKNRTPYCATKWGMIGLARAVAEEAGPYNIRVNTICPGAVAGERFDAVLRRRAADNGCTVEEMLEKTLADTPLRRMVTEEEVAAAALFLAGDGAAGITGAEIIVSGGRR